MIKDNSLSSKILTVVIHITLILLVALTLFPVLHVLAVSLSSTHAYTSGMVSIFPREITFEAYRSIWRQGSVPRGYLNTIYYTALGTFINLLLTSMTAYPLSRERLTFRKFYNGLIIFTMFVSGGMVPTFLLVKDLGIYNSVWAMVLPNAVTVWNLVLLRTNFKNIPLELEESAFLDGANEFTIFFRIILPLSKAGLATIGLFYAVGHWNTWFSALLYLKDSAKYPLQLILREIVIQGSVQMEQLSGGEEASAAVTSVESIKYATLFASLVPMLVVYPFVQKYFVKGVMVGSLKG